MVALIQVVDNSTLMIDNKIVSNISLGMVVYVGVGQNDGVAETVKLATKVAKARIFQDENDKINYDITQIKGDILVVSNFTLLADFKRTNRPNFSYSAQKDTANQLYQLFYQTLSELTGIKVKTGVFGADMIINSQINGPVNLIIDTDKF